MKWKLIDGLTEPPPQFFVFVGGQTSCPHTVGQKLYHNFNNIPVFKSSTLIAFVISDNVWEKIIKLSKTFDRKIFFRICTMQQEHGFSRWC